MGLLTALASHQYQFLYEMWQKIEINFACFKKNTNKTQLY